MIISFLKDESTKKEEKITLVLNGRKVTFSEKKLQEIFEEYPNVWRKVPIFRKGEMCLTLEDKKYYFFKDEVSKFLEKSNFDLAETTVKVNYELINKELFKEPRSDMKQEKLRMFILDAFKKVRQNKKYTKEFWMVIPKNTWEPGCKTTKEIVEIAYNYGNHLADWVELALTWAQRISNGESWDTICNKPDSAKYFRVFEENGKVKFVGGSSLYDDPIPKFDFGYYCENDYKLYYTVPYIVQY